jgi:acid phosphatase family membrane protein YuiD
MFDVIRDKPFLIGILAGAVAQLIKVLTFLVLEKKVNYRRFVQSEGIPDMHVSAMSALTLAIGLKEGFGSPLFALPLSLSSLIFVNTVGVKKQASQQAEVVDLMLQRIMRKKQGKRGSKADIERYQRIAEGVRHAPVDVLTGMALGCVISLFVF